MEKDTSSNIDAYHLFWIIIIPLAFLTLSCQPQKGKIKSEPDNTHTLYPTRTSSPAKTITPIPQLTSTPTPSPTHIQQKMTSSGIIRHDETWSGVHHVTGDIRCFYGVKITIEPGTKVIVSAYFDDQSEGLGWGDTFVTKHGDPTGTTQYQKNAITIRFGHCQLIAIGTSDQPIIFTTDHGNSLNSKDFGSYSEILFYAKEDYPRPNSYQPESGAGSWNGMWVGDAVMEYVIIENGKGNLNIKGPAQISHLQTLNSLWYGIDIHYHNVIIQDSYISGGGHHCVNFFDSATVNNIETTNCNVAIGIETSEAIEATNITAIDCVNTYQVRGVKYNTDSILEFSAVIKKHGDPDGWFFSPPEGWMETVFGDKIIKTGARTYQTVNLDKFTYLRTGLIYPAIPNN